MGTTARRVELLMGTAIAVELVDVPGTVDADALLTAAFAWFAEVDRRFSTYRPDSEVCRLSRGELRVQQVSADLRHVLDACEEMRTRTGGYFDAYAGGGLDPSGYVKGWSVEVASRRLSTAGVVNHSIEAGGDIRVAGVGPDGTRWRTGIVHPWQKDRYAWFVAGTDLAIATSGTYERGLHVVDPLTGARPDHLCSVTVTGPDLGVADSYATAALAMGERGIDWLATLRGYESAVITKHAEAYRSAGFPAIDLPAGDPAATR